MNDPRRLMVRELAQTIYDVVYLPGVADGGDEPMPPFETAEKEELGGFVRAVEAAELVVCRLLRADPQPRSGHSVGGLVSFEHGDNVELELDFNIVPAKPTKPDLAS